MKLLMFIFTLFLAAISCQTENQTQKETWWINSAKVDCTGVGPMSCFQIQKGTNLEDGKWELLYDQIEGFDYEPGHIYQVEVEVSQKEEPLPADASSLSYKLVKKISETQDAGLALSNIWKVLHVGSIKDPKSANGEALIFELDGAQGIYLGNTDCNSIRGGFATEGKDGIKFGPGAATMMACPTMEAETEVKKALQLIRKFDIENNVLYLRDELGQALMSLRAVD